MDRKQIDAHWIGMPEFQQPKSPKPYAEIIIRFKSGADLRKFSELVGKNLSSNTKSIWYPPTDRGKYLGFYYAE